MVEEIKINIGNIKKSLSNIFGDTKKFTNILLIILMLALLIGGSWIRLQNMPLLKDQTTGEYIPLALDPFYFLRIAQTMISPDGLPSYDNMRYPSAHIPFISEILPETLVFMYKIAHTFSSEVTIQYIGVIYPVIFYILGLIAFYFLVFLLTKSKLTSALSSIFLAFIPSYLYRTMAGFADHEAIGMFAFFITLAVYTLGINYLEKENKDKNSYLKVLFFAILTGFLSLFTIASWGGVSNFIFMIIPLSFFLIWIIKFKSIEDINKKLLNNYFIFYVIWFIFSIVITSVYSGSLSSAILKISFSGGSILNGFVFLFLISEYLIINFWKNLPRQIIDHRKYHILFSTVLAVILAIFAIQLTGNNMISFISNLVDKLIHPFGTARTSLTVAENKQPYLLDWISDIGKYFFWVFFTGIVLFGARLSSMLSTKKEKITFTFIWIILISGIIFSRISQNSLLNGENFISKIIYAVSLLIFCVYFIYSYFKKDLKNIPNLMIILSWLFFMLISARGAIRLFFVVTPLVCFIGAYGIVELYKFILKTKDELGKLALILILIGILVLSILSVNSFISSASQQAKSTGPSAGAQWQNAMAWVRENTPEGSIFTHWWDYGYWVEYLGQRPALSDGGHAVGYWDHLVGRYILTTPNPNTALSMMKTNNVSYLLIDPTDIGKYSAFSKIGSDETGEDRFSGIPQFIKSNTQTKDTANGTLNFYQGGFYVDEDIIYNNSDQQIFIPKNVGYIGGILFEESKGNSNKQISQPYGVFIYNNKQISIPLRYIYSLGRTIDFGGGLDSMVYIIPSVSQVNGQLKIDPTGATFYLSKKVKNGLLAQIYLIGNVSGKYSSFKLVHSEQNQIVSYLNNQGSGLEDIVYLNGVLGPIKIWQINYPENILENKEFLRTEGGYAEFDNLNFTK